MAVNYLGRDENGNPTNKPRDSTAPHTEHTPPTDAELQEAIDSAGFNQVEKKLIADRVKSRRENENQLK